MTGAVTGNLNNIAIATGNLQNAAEVLTDNLHNVAGNLQTNIHSAVNNAYSLFRQKTLQVQVQIYFSTYSTFINSHKSFADTISLYCFYHRGAWKDWEKTRYNGLNVGVSRFMQELLELPIRLTLQMQEHLLIRLLDYDIPIDSLLHLLK